MNTSLGYSKKTLTDSNVLLSGGGDKALSEFIGSLNWDSTNKKLQYKSASSTNFTDLITFGSNAFTSYSGYNIVFLNNEGTTVDTFKALTSPSKTLKAGTNVQMTAASNVITITATDTTYSVFTGASSSAAGSTGLVKLPSAGDLEKFLRGDSTWLTVNLNVTSALYVGASNGTGNSAQSTNGNVYLIFAEGSSYSRYKIVGSGRASVTSDASGNITINSSGYSNFGAATASAAGSAGLVPAPGANVLGSAGYYLRADGTWQKPPNDNTWKAANSSQEGYVPKSTANKILRANANGALYWGDDANTTYTFYNLLFQNSGGTTVDTYKPTTSPTKTLKAGSNVTISAASNVITIASTNTWNAMTGATSSANGTVGYVNATPPKDGYNTKFLRADGTWSVPAYPTKSSWNYNDKYVASVSISGNNLRVNKNGTNTDLTIPYASSAGNADKIDNKHLSQFWKHGGAYPQGKSDKPWHKIATFTQSNASSQINTSLTLYISEYYYQQAYGILNIRARAESGGATLTWLKLEWILNVNIPVANFIGTYKKSENDIIINIYASRTGWSSYSAVKIEEQAWAEPHDAWTLISATNSNNSYASIPSDETQVTSVICTLNHNISGSAGSVAWSDISSKPETATRWSKWSEITDKPDATGNATTPVYWNGSGFTNCTAYGSASVNYANYSGYAPQVSKTSITSLSNFTHSTNLIYSTAGGSNSVADKPSGVDAFGVISYKTADGWYGQLLTSSNTASGLYWRTGTSLSGGWKKVLDSDNSSVSKSGETLTVKINGTSQSLTNTNTWRGIQNNLTSSSNTTESLSAKQGYLLANGSARDSTKLPLSGGTMTGTLTVKLYIFGYNYNHAGGNAPAFVFDKPGSNYTGIGANGESDTIYFSAATLSNGEASWVTSYKQKWKFNGTIYQEGNAVIHAGNIGSQSVNYATSAGNADTVDSQHFKWSNDSNSPTYLWAANSSGTAFLCARGSMSVNYANSAGSATTATRFAYADNWNVGEGINTVNLITCGDTAATGAPSAYTSGISIMTSYVGFQLCTYGGASETLYFRKLEDNGTWHNWYEVITGANIGSQSVNYATSAGNADTVDGYHASGGNTPFGTIPVIVSSGFMDVGNSFEMHYDNTTGSDFSTRLYCTGNYGNSVALPSTTGTLALTSQIPTNVSQLTNDSGFITSSASITGNAGSATKLQTARTIWGKSFDGTGDIDGHIYVNGYYFMVGNNSENVSTIDNAGNAQPIFGYGQGRTSRNVTYTGYNVNICGGSVWNSTSGIYITSSNDIGIGTNSPSYKLHVNGTFYASDNSSIGGNLTATNFYTTSDRNKKTNISSFSEHIRKFQLKDTEKWHYGVVAQEVPEMFRDGEEGNMTVNYNSVLSYYVGCLENSVAGLENAKRLLENRVKELEDKLKKYEDKFIN